MHYRKIYENKVSILPKDFEVHHLDCNRENNDIYNLVHLPKKIHSKLHSIKNRYDKSITSINEYKYFYTSEKKKYLKYIEDYIDFKTKILSFYISERDMLILNKNNNGKK